jgi:HSP20 family protein
MYESMLSFPGAVFGDFERLRRQLDDLFGPAGQPSSIRSVAPGAFPAVNIGHTPHSVEIYAFAPGIDASKVDVSIDRGVLTIAGERRAERPASASDDASLSVYSRERVNGSFRRAITLPDDVDVNKVEARYRDGVLRISVARHASAQPRRISVQ